MKPAGQAAKVSKRTLTRADALSARPTQNPDTQLVRHANGGQLLIVLPAPRWAGWFFSRPSGARKTFELDEIGLFVWDNCNAENTVADVIRSLAVRYHLNPRVAEVSTIAFLRTLVRRGLVVMEMR